MSGVNSQVSGPPEVVRRLGLKPFNDTSIITTLTVDPDLVVSLDANRVYLVNCQIFVTNPAATAGFKWAFDRPGGVVRGDYHGVQRSVAASLGAGNQVANNWGVTIARSIGAGVTHSIMLSGLIASVDGGILQLKWAQNVLDAANPTTLFQNAFLSIIDIGGL